MVAVCRPKIVAVLIVAFLVLFAAPPRAQQTGTIRVVVTLVDTDLKVRPVPQQAFQLRGGVSIPPLRLVTDREGRFEAPLDAGSYELLSEQPVEFQGRIYRWTKRLTVGVGEIVTLNLTAADADVTRPAAGGADPLPALFRKWEPSVATIWSEIGHGTGFVVDASGLIATCDHVLGRSEYVAVQFTSTVKVAARVVARSVAKNVAILQVNPSVVVGRRPVVLATGDNGQSTVVEGQRVFTIGSPLNQRKVITSGIVSKVEQKAILSDVTLTFGSSGGPLFTMDGVVVGMTTFRDVQTAGGAGISGVLAIREVLPEILAAIAGIDHATPPSDALLPVDPQAPFSLAAVEARLRGPAIDSSQYRLIGRQFDLLFITPMLTYSVESASRRVATAEQSKRGESRPTNRPGELFSNFKGWSAYVGQYRAVLMLDVKPQVTEPGWRGFGGKAKMHFKADFTAVKLYCGPNEVPPIHPGRIEHLVAIDNAQMQLIDTTSEGLYVFGPESIGPQCGPVRVVVLDAAHGDKGETVTIPPAMVSRVWDDFAAYRRSLP